MSKVVYEPSLKRYLVETFSTIRPTERRLEASYTDLDTAKRDADTYLQIGVRARVVDTESEAD